MSSLPIPLLSLLRKFISEISVKRSHSSEAQTKPYGVLASLLRAAAIPSLGYLLGWNSRPGTASVGNEGASSSGEPAKKQKPSSMNLPPSRDGKEPKPTKVGNQQYDPTWPIYQLMNNPVLLDPVRRPRNPIVLSHGLYGFDVRGFTGWISLQIHYWSDVLEILRKKVGAEVIVTRAPSTGSIQERADRIHQFLKKEASGKEINFIAHSMGGLDCRHLISNIRPENYTPISLTTVCTPHRGSPFMDWLKDHIGIGGIQEPLPGVIPASPSLSRPASIISFIDSPAYSNLTSHYLNTHFNPCTPDSPLVKYYSVAARTPGISFFHPLFIPKLITDSYEQKRHESGKLGLYGNDGLVPVESARWGEFLGILEECDHWDIRGAGGLSAHFVEEIKEENRKEGTVWNWSDWQKFLGTWSEIRSTTERNDSKETINEKTKKVSIIATLEDPKMKKDLIDAGEGPKLEKAESDKSSTMDQVLDWVVDNVPGISTVAKPLKGTAERSVGKEIPGNGKVKREETKPPRFDLEKFYIALCQRLYDEGL